MIPNDMIDYLEGKKLYGDDMPLDEIKAWHEDEREGYASLKGKADRSKYQYSHHGLNRRHGFRHLPKTQFSRVLGFGSAYGDEFEPIAHPIARLTIVDPSDSFVQKAVFGIPAQYVKPEITGTLPFENDCFDLIVCLGALHHVPNVSYVIGEFCRCLKPDGFALVREPIVSMGDWRKFRPNLTKRERGIPIGIFRKIINELDFKVIKETFCVFLALPKLFGRFFSGGIYNNDLMTCLDELSCRVLTWNITYHPIVVLEKFMPTSVYYVLSKDDIYPKKRTQR